MEKKYVVINGNPLDGFTITGPFDDSENALMFAQKNRDECWWVTPINQPS